MRLSELQQALRAADPAAMLVAPAVLERLIQQERKLPVFVWSVPHRKVYVVDRHVLFRHVEQDELGLEPDRLLPPTVLLLARPSPEELNNLKREDILLQYWRLLFHANVHLDLEKRWAETDLTLAGVRERIEQLGQAEFDEIRRVLGQDGHLLPPEDDRSVYAEFAAVYLEVRYFAANLLPISFPAIVDFDQINRLLGRDLNADDIFTRTRLPGAPDPVVRTDNSSDESHDYYWRLVHRAEKASRAGNTVRAAIVRTRAARVAPAHLGEGTKADALEEMKRLTARLQAALGLSPAGAAEWLRDLPALLDKADQGDQGSRPVEASLLYDLQNVCLDHERDVYALDLVEWLLSAGKRPIKRPLPAQRQVRILKHLRSAAQRLTMARLSDADRQHLNRLLQAASNKCEERLRDRIRPLLVGALQDVGLRAESPPERTAFHKLIEELLDRIAEHGFLTFSDLRDTISRNQMKLPDLGEPQEFVRGDPLLRLDRRLMTLLDGVYRPGDFYLKLLERFTALGFGTHTGRQINRNFVFPFGAALLLIFALVHIVGWFTPAKAVAESKQAVVAPAAVPEPVARQKGDDPPAENANDEAALAAEKKEKEEPPKQQTEPAHNPPAKTASAAPAEGHAALTPIHWAGVVILGAFFLALIRNEQLRRRCAWLGVRLGRGLRYALIEVPRKIVHNETMQWFAASWPFQLFYWYLFKPLIAAALVAPLVVDLFREPKQRWVGLVGTFLIMTLLLNTRLGQGTTDAFAQTVVKLYELLRAGLLPGLFRLIQNLFKRVMDGVEAVLFSVDEWLRFRAGDSRFSMAVRAVLGVLWFPVQFLARLYLVVLIEPGFNPIKAPLSILFAKFVYPALFAGVEGDGMWAKLSGRVNPLAYDIQPYVGDVWAWTIAWVTVAPVLYFLPDVLTFFFWEMKENWRLYRANRPATLRPVLVGQHGETVLRLLHPGVHSGTVPRLYAQLRQAVRDASRTGNWRAARASRRSLQEVERTLQRFVARELVTLVEQSPSWQGNRLTVGWVMLATNRIRAELIHDAFPANSVWLEIEDRGGWLVAGVRDPGWLPELTPEQRQVVTTALAGLYKLAGIDLVHEQLRANVPAGIACYDITERGLVLWLDQRHGQAVCYDLSDPRGLLEPEPMPGAEPGDGPVLDAARLLFSQMPIYWDQWVGSWQKDQEGKGPPKLFEPGLKLLPLFPA